MRLQLRTLDLFIAGRWRPGAGGYGPVVNPAAISPDSRRVSSGPEGIVRPVLSRIRQRHLDVEAVR